MVRKPHATLGSVVFAVALVLASLSAASAATIKGEFDNLCTEGLANGKQNHTDCSIHETIDGKIYCFGTMRAKAKFDEDPAGNLAKAKAFYATLQHK
jgi:YHS domain-containing protein